MQRDHLGTYLLLGGVAAFALYAWKRGSIGAAAADIGAGAVDVVGHAAGGAVSEIGASVGLPTIDQTTTDPAVARWIIDYPSGGYAVASAWSGVPALAQAALMPSGSGSPPPEGTALYARFPPAQLSTTAAQSHYSGSAGSDTGSSSDLLATDPESALWQAQYGYGLAP